MKNEKWHKEKIITNWDRIRKPCFDDGTNGEKQDRYDFKQHLKQIVAFTNWSKKAL
jgi:hypothetical protein